MHEGGGVRSLSGFPGRPADSCPDAARYTSHASSSRDETAGRLAGANEHAMKAGSAAASPTSTYHYKYPCPLPLHIYHTPHTTGSVAFGHPRSSRAARSSLLLTLVERDGEGRREGRRRLRGVGDTRRGRRHLLLPVARGSPGGGRHDEGARRRGFPHLPRRVPGKPPALLRPPPHRRTGGRSGRVRLLAAR
jgi:hypothetical protein